MHETLPAPQFRPPPGLPMPPTIVQVKTPVALPLFPKLLQSGSALYSDRGLKPQGCLKSFCAEDTIKVCEKRNGISIRVGLEMSSENPWFLSPISPPPGLPPMSETNAGITCCEPCMDGKVGQEHLETQKDNVTGPQPFPLSFPSIGSTLHGTGMCKPCCWFWKPEGCKNKESCRHCHLCTKADANQRKINCKAIRMGLLPQRSPYIEFAH